MNNEVEKEKSSRQIDQVANACTAIWSSGC